MINEVIFQPVILHVKDFEEEKKDEFIKEIESYLQKKPTNRLVLWFENYYSGTYCSNCGKDVDDDALRKYWNQMQQFGQNIAELFFINVVVLLSKEQPKFFEVVKEVFTNTQK